MNSTAPYSSECQVGHGMARSASAIIHSARLALFFISAKRMHEVWPAVLVRESNTNVFAGYKRQILYIFTNFQASERLH